MITKGAFMGGTLSPVNGQVLTAPGSVPSPNTVYQVELTLEKAMTPGQEKAAVDTIWNSFRAPGVTLIGVQAGGDKIDVQFRTASALVVTEWEGILAIFPALLGAIVPLIILVMVWTLLMQIPGVLWSLILVGGLFIAGLVLVTGAKSGARGSTKFEKTEKGWGLVLA